MAKSTNKLTHSINLLVGLASAITAQGWLAKTAYLTTAYFTGKEIFKPNSKEAINLSKDLHASAMETLEKYKPEIGDDADILLADMIAFSLPTPTELVNQDLTADNIVALMLFKLTQPSALPDYKTDDMKSVFKIIVRSTLKTLLNSPEFIKTLAPIISQSILTRLIDISEVLKSLEKHYGSLANSLDELRQLNLTELQVLALRFEINDALDLEKPSLLEHLTSKAQECHALKADVDAIDDTMRGLANLKSAAKDAIDRLDFEAVETLLAMVQEAELDAARKTAELRATNALMRGRAPQAYTIFSATADSFAAIDAELPLTLRDQFAIILAKHGARYGGDGLILAIEMWRTVLNKTTVSTHPALWASAQNNLAIALEEQGTRSDGAAGAELLAQAVTAAYRDTLSVYTKDQHPVQWAMTQNTLGMTLRKQGIRSDGMVGAEFLAQAVTAYRNALTVYTKDQHPVDWATTLNNLAVALKEQSGRSDGAAREELLAQAVTAYRNALTVRTKDQHPEQWAMTQNNLAGALQKQGTRSIGAAGADLMEHAITASHRALTVYTKDQHPAQWAMTQENLARVYVAIAQHDSTTNPRDDLARALEHAVAALTVFDPVHMSYNHAKATRLRDGLRADLAELS